MDVNLNKYKGKWCNMFKCKCYYTEHFTIIWKHIPYCTPLLQTCKVLLPYGSIYNVTRKGF